MTTKQTTQHLTPGEAFYVYRRRAKLSQEKMAKRHRVSVYQLIRWEGDVVPVNRRGKSLSIPKMKIQWSDLTAGERCVVMRMRSGMTRLEVAQAVGVSCTWLSAMECDRESPAKLLRYWGLTASQPQARAA